MIRPVVVKVGGSLLDWPGLPTRLAQYLNSRRHERLVLVVGGGPSTDVVRALDRVHALGEESAHQLALRSLDLTAHILATLVANLVVVDRRDALAAAWGEGKIPVFAPRLFLDQLGSSSAGLPHSWDVTSDSIAACVAEHLGAAELAMLKSTSVPPGTSRGEAARLGLVDPVFPEASRRLERVTCLNLRDPEACAVTLKRS